MAKFRQLLLLIWKNFKLQIRHPWVTLLELGVPSIFSIILVFVRSTISSEYVANATIYDSFGIDELPKTLRPTEGPWELLFMPNTTFLRGFMEAVAADLKVESKGFNSESEMESYYSDLTSLGGIVFEDSLKDGINSTSNLSFTIRPRTAEPPSLSLQGTLKFWFTDRTFPLMPALGPRNRDDPYGGNPGYMSKGFLSIQHAVSKQFIKVLDPNFSQKLNFDVMMCRYPYPPYLDDKFIIALALFFPMVIVFSFLYPAANIVKNIVVEKENKIKEAMKMMGLSKWLHWAAWYIKYFLFLCISCAIVTLLLCVRFHDLAVINKSDPSFILFLLMVYTSSFICFCFLLSTLFNKGNSAAAGAGVICFLTFVPYFFIVPRYQTLSYGVKLLSCLLPNLALSVGSIVLTTAEAIGNGLQWDNFTKPPSADSDLSMSSILLMFVIDGVLCLFLTWYIDAVYPGEYGVPERWDFLFTRSYWCGHNSSFSDMEQFYNSEIKPSEFFEDDPDELMLGIQIMNLTKVYGKAVAVNNINLNMYRGHITALLGHNGAGKTTTISMLTGLITPTSGTALVNGYDIREDMDSVHSNLGICPQHDILFDELTVEEHLYFFCKLKGYISDLVSSEIERIITCLSLEPYRNTQTKNLSGGWKRKISVGIAFVGGSRIVILDEPTSGMDAFNRRALWEVLETEKEDRTILLTTHYMEEADALGDRIAIMADGEIQCCGSPLFLKRKYGAGYHLTMVKEPGCDTSLVAKIIFSHVPNAEETSNIGRELKFSLPKEDGHVFSNLFRELDDRRSELKISSYGASITTMEEVFIKVGKKETAPCEINLETPVLTIVSKESTSTIDSGIHVVSDFVDDSGTEVDLQSLNEHQIQSQTTGYRLYLQHLSALLIKRILHSYRNLNLTISQIFLPPCFLILTMIVLKTLPKPKDAPPLNLDINSFQGTNVPYAADASNESSILASIFASQFQQPNLPVHVNEKITDYLLRKGDEDIGKYNMHDMIAASFEKNDSRTTITSLFNNKAYHTPAIALLEVERAVLKYFTNDSYTFSITNYPMPRMLIDKGKQEQTQTTESYQIAQDIMFGMSFLIASFAVFIVKERASNSKHLQRVSGMSLSSYWLASFLWDFLNYLMPCFLVFLVFVAFKTDGFNSPIEIGRLFLLFFLHGFAALPFVYCCTFAFYSPATAYVRLSLFNILAGIACLLAITILEIPELDVRYVAQPLDVVFSLLMPNYALGRGVANLYQNNQFNRLCNNQTILQICDYPIPKKYSMYKACCKGKFILSDYFSFYFINRK